MFAMRLKKLLIFITLLLVPLRAMPDPVSFEDWKKTVEIRSDGKIKSDPISSMPEISNLAGIDNKGNIKIAIGIELFHNRNKPRNSKIKKELQISNNEVAIGISKIIVPVFNATIGPFFGFNTKDKTKVYGVRIGIFKF